ncbi:MAG: hypothetical protein HC876_03560 [Chloroflexaceae bacterium]|nr:hypothetical protein [Chloroflexaceae bacterium]
MITVIGVLLAAMHLSMAPAAAAPATRGAQAEGVTVSADGSISLAAASGPALRLLADEAGQRYGFYIAAPQALSAPTTGVQIQYRAETPAGTRVALDVRGSLDSATWTEWQIDVAPSTAVALPHPAQYVQYRARLFGTTATSPVIADMSLEPLAGPTFDAPPPTDAPAADAAIAPTFRIRGTRLGLVGWRTANGHVIQPRDHFVSLPSWSSLSSKGGHEYEVRITFHGRSVVAPVWDVGPWNTRDDYWDVNRDQYPELAQGWPQDHAAYYEKHNGGYAEKGYVRFPTAIDIADGVWWDHLGLIGDQATLDVTFLWLGRDPLALPAAEAPSSDPNAAEYMVDELGPAFSRSEALWYESPQGCGENAYALWTQSVTDTLEVVNRGFWQPDLPIGGMFDVYAHVPICPIDADVTTAARYLVQHAEGSTEVVVNQAEQTAWVHLGRFPFAAGTGGFVYLTEVAGDTGKAVWFDNVRWVPVREETTAPQ